MRLAVGGRGLRLWNYRGLGSLFGLLPDELAITTLLRIDYSN
jgi:hypothetical protein